jgi:MoaA/NifB/PqqE/SkfB family radical SAM enzyme
MAGLDAAPLTSAEQSHATKGLVRLTMACNERCPFCNVPVEDYAVRTTPEHVIEAELAELVASGAQTVTVSGGEPTLLRKRLCKLVSDARARSVPFVELQTNAVLLDESYARELAAAGLTSAFVSLLSHVPEHHDTLAGLAGAFPRCLAGIDALLDAGIRVTLNPVVASLTQELLPDFIDFVATRLSRVRSISLSAVQPHGRARHDLDLLPDYAVLARVIPTARTRAAAANIELLNPYCGLPVCVGWADALGSSVEAIEAAEPFQDGPAAIGLINRGDKRHGPACRRCALRSRCGGAWHAYWDHRGGSGLQPPVELVPPWAGASPSGTPAVWSRELDAACTDVAIVLDPDNVDLDLLRRVRARLRAEEHRLPQRRRAVHFAVGPGSAHGIHRAVGLIKALGLPDVTLLGRPDPRLREALAREWQLEVRCVDGPEPPGPAA